MVVAALIYTQIVERRVDMLVAKRRERKNRHIRNNRYNNLPGPVWYNRLNPHEFSWRVNDSYFVQVVYFDITDDTKTSLLRTLNARPCGWGSLNQYDENGYEVYLIEREIHNIMQCYALTIQVTISELSGSERILCNWAGKFLWHFLCLKSLPPSSRYVEKSRYVWSTSFRVELLIILTAHVNVAAIRGWQMNHFLWTPIPHHSIACF
jgi:hypothetical protein